MSRRKPSFFLSRIDGLCSAPEIANSFSAIFMFMSCQEYCFSCAQMSVTSRRVSKPDTSGCGPMRSPRQFSHSAERGGTSDRPCMGLRGFG